MSIKLTCPECSAQYPIAAGLIDDDGKRLAALTGEMEPAMARAALSYLKFFKPAKTSLRTSRALVILQELHELVRSGTVCKDERGGMRRPATFRAWIAGIENMHQVEARLTLPLANHNYLRSIVFGLADGIDAKAEATHDAGIRNNARTIVDDKQPMKKIDVKLDILKDWHARGLYSKEQYDAKLAEHNASLNTNNGDAP